MQLRPEQKQLALEGLLILKTNHLVYFACEERTGKTLSSIHCAELAKAKSILVITKKKALAGWEETLKAYKTGLKITITTYSQLHKLSKQSWDLAILDEAHNYLSSYPKPAKTWKLVKQLVHGLDLIYLSATPHAQGYSMLYHQLALSYASPFKRWLNFYAWHKHFGVPKSTWVSGREIVQYDACQDDLVKAYVDHLFITKTRAELGFEQEPEDAVHYIELGEDTRYVYNKLLKDKMVQLSVGELVCDSVSKLRYALHMLEGGVCKIGESYHTLRNTEKVDFIKTTFGDVPSLVIMYQYIEEGNKLRSAFKHAAILQGSANAEGVDLSSYKDLVIYSQDFSTAKHSQRRARQANFKRKDAIVVHYLLVKGGISEQVYNCVSQNKVNFVDSRFERTKV